MSHQSDKEVILVTGATGSIGKATIRHLSSCDNVIIRALVLEDEKSSPELQELSKMPNVEVVHGNLANKQRLEELLDDVKRALLVCPNVSDQIQLEKNFIQAAKKRNLDLVIKVSILSPMSLVSKESSVSFAHNHAEAERLLKDSGLGHVILRPNFFFENVLWFKDEILNSQSISVPCPRVPATMIAVDDVGKIASAILAERTSLKKFLGKTLELTGPESLSFEEIAKQLSKRIGKEISVKEIDSDTLVKNLHKINLSEEMRNGLKPIFDDYWSKGAFNCQGSNTDLPSTPSTTFNQWLDKHVSLFHPQLGSR